MQSIIEKTQQNKNRIDYDYKIGYDIIITNHTSQKYETPYKVNVVIKQFLPKGTINLQYGPTKKSYNIYMIKPYKSNTKVEDSNSLNISGDANIYSSVIYFYMKY